MNYISQVFEVRQTTLFAEWHRSLKDKKAAKAIASRLLRLQSGLFGDAKSVGDGLSELRIHLSPGYRVYFIRRGNVLIVVLWGGVKKTQQADIEEAKRLAGTIRP